MRPQYIGGLIIGILLMYLGFMGTAGFGFAQKLTWTSTSFPTKEDFNDLNGWQPYGQHGGSQEPVIDSGNCVLQAGNGTGATDDRSGIDDDNFLLFSSYVGSATITFYMKIDPWPSSGKVEWQFKINNMYFGFDLNATNVFDYLSQHTWSHSQIDSSYHTYTIIATSTANSVHQTFYIDAVNLGTSTSVITAGSLGKIAVDAWHGITAYIDYINVVQGAVAPTGGGTPPPGGSSMTINIHTQRSDGSALGSVAVYVSGPESHSWTTDSNGYFQGTVNTAGTYHFTGTINGQNPSSNPDLIVTNNGGPYNEILQWGGGGNNNARAWMEISGTP